MGFTMPENDVTASGVFQFKPVKKITDRRLKNRKIAYLGCISNKKVLYCNVLQGSQHIAYKKASASA